MKKKLALGAGIGLMTVLSALSIAGTAYAAGPVWGARGAKGDQPGITGTVSAVNGSILTVNGRGLGRNVSATTSVYTVNASDARVVKNGATSSISTIAAGDKVFVRGMVNGTSVTATLIRDGADPRQRDKGGWLNRTSSLIQGNGQPVIAGTISAISGTTLTVNAKSSVQYSVDASNAKIMENGNQTSLSKLAIGDTVIVQGGVSGTQVTASSVIAQKAASNVKGSAAAKQAGFLGRISQFFLRLFGF